MSDAIEGVGSPTSELPTNWHNVLWFTSLHCIGIGTLTYDVVNNVFDARTYALATLMFIVGQISISAGAHSLYAHGAYTACRPLQYFLLCAFSSVFQGPAKWWAMVHMQHHDFTDTPLDPHSPAQRGFWHAHVGWLLVRGIPLAPRAKLVAYGKAIRKQELLNWQARNHNLLALGFGLVGPTFVAALWGDALGGLMVAGLTRLVFQYHATWSVNSCGHTFGARPYGGTATDSVLLALPTVGESYHATHHRWPAAMLGPHWYSIAPAKWFVATCALLGFASNVKYVRP